MVDIRMSLKHFPTGDGVVLTFDKITHCVCRSNGSRNLLELCSRCVSHHERRNRSYVLNRFEGRTPEIKAFALSLRRYAYVSAMDGANAGFTQPDGGSNAEAFFLSMIASGTKKDVLGQLIKNNSPGVKLVFKANTCIGRTG